MKSLGQYLRSERERQKLTLEELADRTKIHIQKLQFIESGNREALPAKVFSIGLVKSYARELKVDLNKIDELCASAFSDQDLETNEPTDNETTDSPSPQPENKMTRTQVIGSFNIPKPLIIAASIALCFFLLFTISQLIEKMNSYSEEENLPQDVFMSVEDEFSKENEISEIEAPDETEKKEIDKEDVPKTPSELKVEKKQEQKNNTVLVAKKEDPINIPPPMELKKKPELDKKEDKVDDDFSDDNFDDFETTETNRVVSDNKLIIKALEPIRAEVIWSDGFVQVMLLKGSESKTLVFSKPITLRVNNGGAVQVTFNNAQTKVPGTFNKPIEIKYP